MRQDIYIYKPWAWKAVCILWILPALKVDFWEDVRGYPRVSCCFRLHRRNLGSFQPGSTQRQPLLGRQVLWEGEKAQLQRCWNMSVEMQCLGPRIHV